MSVEDVDLISREKLVVVLFVEPSSDNSGIVASVLCQSVWQVSSREKSTPEVDRILMSFVKVQVEKVARRIVVSWWRVRVSHREVEVAGPFKFFR